MKNVFINIDNQLVLNNRLIFFIQVPHHLLSQVEMELVTQHFIYVSYGLEVKQNEKMGFNRS